MPYHLGRSRARCGDVGTVVKARVSAPGEAAVGLHLHTSRRMRRAGEASAALETRMNPLRLLCIHGGSSSSCVDCAELRALRKLEGAACAVIDVCSLDALLELEQAIQDVKQVRSAAFEPELGTSPTLTHVHQSEALE